MICTKSCNLLLDDLAQSIFYLEWRTFGLDLDFDFGGFCLRLLDCHIIFLLTSDCILSYKKQNELHHLGLVR